MKYPHFLEENGTIGFVAPSFGCQIEPYYTAFGNALKKFQSMGYGVDLGPNCYAGEGIGISNTPEKCAAELMEYYQSTNNDCLISCGGGELMCEILEHMDFEALKEAEPKWYMGYSDNTNMTYLLATLCDTASIYGPCAAAFGMEPWHEALTDAINLLTGKVNETHGYDKWEKDSLKNEENPLVPYNVTEPRVLKCFDGCTELLWTTKENADIRIDEEKNELDVKTESGHDEATLEERVDNTRVMADGETVEMHGRLLGGCMDCLVTLLGTKFDKTVEFADKYKEDGIIWFLEACDLNVFGIRRAMWQMEQAGWFQYVKGFIIGRPLCFGQEMMGLDAYKAVLEVAGRKDVPVIMDADIGHLAPMMPIVNGSMATVEVCGNDISIKYEFS